MTPPIVVNDPFDYSEFISAPVQNNQQNATDSQSVDLLDFLNQ